IHVYSTSRCSILCFLIDPAPSSLYPLSLHDALPISWVSIPSLLKMSASSLIRAILTSRCVFSMTLAASATLIEGALWVPATMIRSEEHTSELQSRENLVCRLLLEKKKNIKTTIQAKC